MAPIDLTVFHDNGYVRKQCRVTGLWFWTSDHSRETCGDTTEDEYTFIGNPIIKGYTKLGRELKDAMRESFLAFFEQRKHTRINPYPVLARWRDDIHLTIASIADFQPHVTSGLAEPPANPLTISQPCIRLTDVDAVGRSGRHLTTFEMMAHHVFNRPNDGKMYYWMEKCVQYCHEMLTDTFGIEAKEITYVENPWSGGGNAGPALEVIVGGLELATLVFMNLIEDENGQVEIKGEKYSEMPLQIIDTGYGLERFCWAAAGTPTIYEAIYPETVKWLKELSGFDQIGEQWPKLDLDMLLGEMSRLNGIMNIEAGVDGDELRTIFISRLAERGITITPQQFFEITDPLSKIYAIPDHLHALCNMLGDGLVPSNAKAGYLARMLARRTLRMRDELGINVSLAELAMHHIKINLNGKRMKQTSDGIATILSLEEQKYGEMLRKGEHVIKSMLKDVSLDATTIEDELLFSLNDVHGITPELAISLANNLGWEKVTIRSGFTAELALRHARMAKDAAKQDTSVNKLSGVDNLPPTKTLFYDDAYQIEFDSSVLHCVELSPHDVDDGITHGIILDRTCFYPEGGGQEHDCGTLSTDSHNYKVLKVSKIDDHIIHYTDGSFEKGDIVHGSVDWNRRKQLMDHHTSVHIIGGSARRILGPHIYQAGANKSVNSARLDITHYNRLTREDLDLIEEMSNEVLVQVRKTEKTVLTRKEADRKHGFDLYQGGAPKSNSIRVIRISDHDIQACAGTHHDDPGQIGSIRIVRSTAVQDGVERLHVVAGQAALDYARHQETLLRQTSDVFGVTAGDVPKTAERFFGEWKEQRKKIEQLEAEIIRLRTNDNKDTNFVKNGVRIVIMEIDGGLKNMSNMLKQLTLEPSNPTLAILGSREDGGKLMVACTENSLASERYNAVEILQAIIPLISGGGGGRSTFAQGGGRNADGLMESLTAAKQYLNLE